MRFAFNVNVNDIVGNLLTVDLFDAATASEPNTAQLAALVFSRENAKAPFVFDVLTMGGPITKGDQLTIRKLAKVFELAVAEQVIGLTPLAILRNIVAELGVQVAWDAQQKRFRCVGTMKEGESVYQLVGCDGLAVEAKDDDTALRLAKRLVTENMIEHPENAEKLAKFFSGGCKLKKMVSGKLPEYTKIESLAQAGEERLAAAPIKLRTTKDDDKE